MNPQDRAEDYLSVMASNGLRSVVNEPTRITATSESSIDHIFVRDSLAESVRVKVSDATGISDHKLIGYTVHLSLWKQRGMWLIGKNLR